MENNSKPIEEEIFTFIEIYNFDELSNDQKALVLQELTVEEYKLMRESLLALQQTPKEKTRKEHIKQELLEKVASQKRPWLFHMQFNMIHMAAAVIITCLCFIPILIKQKQPHLASIPQLIHDTIIQIKTEPAKLITQYDTVYIKQKPIDGKKQERKYVRKTELRIPPADIAIQSFEQLNQNINLSKKSSIKDDPLLRMYGFVTL